MLIGAIADDFTGASDIANTLAKGITPEGGLKTAQFPGIPTTPAPEGIEAGVISLKSRTAPVADAVRESLAALDWLMGQGCRQIIFKDCSTFDSTPEGNIGPVADALLDRLGVKGAVVCPAFPATGRTVYHGHLFVLGKLLNESGMENHPLTPMTDPDIRRWLARQSGNEVAHVPFDIVTSGAEAVRQALKMATGLVVADAVSNDDLLTLGRALDGAQLITGGSGIALGLPRNFIRAGDAKGGGVASVAIDGPAAILAGSCSGATRGQIARHAVDHPTLAIDVPAVMDGRVNVRTLTAFIEANTGRAPLVYSSGVPQEVSAIQNRFGREAVAHALDTLFADTALALLKKGYRRIVVAGGETSGAVAQAVAQQRGSSAMRIGPEIDPGVPVLVVGEDAPVALALKSGNFGTEDFFAKALRRMEGRE